MRRIDSDAQQGGTERGHRVRGRTIVILAVWLAAAGAGLLAWSDLGARLSSTVNVPGSESAAVETVVRDRFGESPSGSLLILVEAPSRRWGVPGFVRHVRRAAARAAAAVGTRASPLQSVSPRISYVRLPTALPAAVARKRVPAAERALRSIAGAKVKVTGFPVISEELTSTIESDLRRAEMVALPVTALILVLLFGSLPAMALPLLFAAATISVAVGLIWLESWLVEIPVYATSVVTLVGIALAVDYSMLYVARYREEARAHGPGGMALARTARTAGRSLIISGGIVAAGLVPLAFVPIPFFGGLGLAAIGIPLVSVLAAVTLLPALLESLGPRIDQLRVRLPRRKVVAGLPERLADLVMRRPAAVALIAGAVMLSLAAPALSLEITGGSAEFLRRAQLPPRPDDGGARQSSLAAFEVIIDGRRRAAAWKAPVLEPERRLVAILAADSDVSAIQAPAELRGPGRQSRAQRLGLVDPDARFARIRVLAADAGDPRASEALAERLRKRYVPQAGFGPLLVAVGGPAASDYDFVKSVTGAAVVLGFVIVVVMYLLLALMLRSLILPIKAIAMSALSVAAACGVMVLVFQFGWGEALGFGHSEEIEAWVPLLLFAALFGISTDYEIFMVTRMREEWLASGDNLHAVRTGLLRIGRVVTASALVMIVIFAGFTTSHVVALQQFGVGLVAGVVLDATVIRLLLVPALMRLLGRWNWTFTAPLTSPAGPMAPPPRSAAIPASPANDPREPAVRDRASPARGASGQ